MMGSDRWSARSIHTSIGIALITLFALSCGGDSTGPGDSSSHDFQLAAESITESDIASQVGVLAHDSMLGRWSPSPQLNEAAEYIADEFSRAGLQPGNDGEFLQWFALPSARMLPGSFARLDSGTGEDLPLSIQGLVPGAPVPGEPGGDLVAPNVIGWIEGSNPQLSHEYVVFTAHFDHIGTSPVASPSGDDVFNGADDNASGTAALLEIAEAFGSLDTPPARSVLFIATSAEERGLVGAMYYTSHPTMPLENAIANLNLDMVGRNDPATVNVIRQSSSDLGELVQAVAAAHDDIGVSPIDTPDDQLVRRSDCFAFLLEGIDALFFHSGLHEDYHGLDDEPERLDAGKTAEVARLAYWVGVELVK
jgi:hypothetical protein